MTDLPHTRTRTVHWIATAAALAGVIGASAFLHPGESTARATEESGVGVRSAPAPPSADSADYPLSCGKAEPEVVDQGSADFDRDGVPETVAVVRCSAGMGTPPSGVYVLAPQEDDTRPRIVETLVNPREGMHVRDFKVSARTISATLLGYSSPEVPRCCPDKERTVKWRWKDGGFDLTPAPVAGRTRV